MIRALTRSSATFAPFGRLGVAMVTPLGADGSLDTDVIPGVVEHLLAAGHDLIVVNGTTGESATTSDEEKGRILATTLAAVDGRASVLAGVGSADTHHSIGLARHAEALGADGLLVVTPYYSRPTQDGLVAHFTAVADATSLPVMLYDVPGRTATPIATATLLELADHPRIVAVKDAKSDLAATTAVLADSDLAVYSGADENNLAWLAVGAVGVVSVVSHVAGGPYARMIAALDSGDLATARAIDRRLAPAVRAIMTRVPGVVAVKAALQLTGVLDHRSVRLPQVPMSDADTTSLKADLAASDLL